ncbi:hypothetical protein H5410_053330 [Solanum commersonii]|uniref:Disease resistance N-terminal domain-containing protein n=1 Tax=Solanum commersonii TaxID=4109 RepID=A0A9J5X4L4_SOLCO|nr:hypothetical protein H5410_053330 [Solanum commersonii]
MTVYELLSSFEYSTNNYQKRTYFEKTLVQTAQEEEANTTMADPVIGATVQVLLEKLISLTIEEFRDCKKDLEMLTLTVSMIQAFIHDAEIRQVEDQSVKLWLNRLERAAENAEYVFDKFRYESLKRQVKIRNNPMRKVSDFFSHTAFKNKMSRKINNINEELRAINMAAKNLGLQSFMVPPRKILPIRETNSIVEKILTIRDDIDLCTIPMVGMGGLGKTTVAKVNFLIGMLDQCRSLQFLRVRSCNNLVSFPLHVWEMPSLSRLEISRCPKLISVPEQLLSLRDLAVYGHGHWDSLLYQLKQLSDLREITIADFGIEALPPKLDNLTSLETLSLVRCKRLQHLNFSDAMPKLRLLWISDCPLLEALSDWLSNLVSLEDLY